jgi:hypothetical protein
VIVILSTKRCNYGASTALHREKTPPKIICEDKFGCKLELRFMINISLKLQNEFVTSLAKN